MAKTNIMKTKQKSLTLLVCVLASSLFLSACTTTTATPEPANYATITGSNTAVGFGVFQNLTMQSTYNSMVSSIDGKDISKYQWSSTSKVAPGPHTIKATCFVNSQPADTALLHFYARPNSHYEITFNMPNPTDFHNNPCQYAVIKELPHT